MDTTDWTRLADRRRSARPGGVASICSAHPLVIEAAMREAIDRDADVLIEATCNQVNQDGGYTGMTPADFRRFAERIADRVGFDRRRLVLGGDHLGPNPWKDLPAEAALPKAEALVAAYAAAGFAKLHLDTSMGCRGEPAALRDEATAERAARLAEIAEAQAARAGFPPPVYVVGTEVPVPGGATEGLDHLEVTDPAAALGTAEVHRRAFAARGLEAAFERAIAIVVQPGVEFGNDTVAVYDPARAKGLSAALQRMPRLVFEAHSTDYQPRDALRALVRDGFAILKVGPGLTFALREALYGLGAIAAVLDPGAGETLTETMERLMLREPGHWRSHAGGGTPDEERTRRHFGYSDRIRYYWPHPDARDAVDRLWHRLDGRRIPETLVSQYLGRLYADVAAGRVAPDARSLALAAVRRVLDDYRFACEG